MSFYIRSVNVHYRADALDATTMSGEEMYVVGSRWIKFDLDGICTSFEDVQLLRELIDHAGANGLDLFRAVASCEWCGSLYPKKELRCRKGCGGPRTKVRLAE